MEAICSNDFNWLDEFNIINEKENKETDENNIIPESFTTNCFSCGTKFKLFLNRAFRCNICYKLFCHTCIIKYKIKLCKNCYQLCLEFKKIINISTIRTIEKGSSFREMRESFYCREFESYKSVWKKFLENEKNNFENQLIVNIDAIYELIVKTFIAYVLKINFVDEKIVNEWKNIIYSLVKETISNLRTCSKFLNDSLDINNYIKIKLIQYKDTSLCKVIKGYILHNKKKVYNIKDKIDDPKILLFNDEMFNEQEQESNKNNSNAEDIQIYYLKLIEKKIDMIRPDIVIIGKNFPKDMINIITNNNFYDISLIYDIESKVMKRLSRCFQTLILPSIKLVGSNNILGTCKEFYIQNINENNMNKDKIKQETENTIENNTEKNNNDLYIFDGCNKLLFNTILLSGSDIIILKKMKKLLRRILLPTVRDLFLQKYVLYTFNIDIPPSIETKVETKFIKELYEEGNEIFPLKKDFYYNKDIKEIDENKEKTFEKNLKICNPELEMTELFYEGFDLSIVEKKENFNIYSLICLTSSQKNKVEIKSNLKEEKEEKISEKEIHNIVNKYCGDGTELNYSFFNDNYDQPLGKFILNLAKKSKSICPTCNLEYSMHTRYLYRAKNVLKIWMISGNENDLDKIINYLNKIKNIDYSKLVPYLNDSHSIDSMYNTDIYTYGYCKICKGIVTRLFKINNEIYNYSSTRFLRFMLENHFSRNQIRDFNYNISNLIVNPKCNHFINKDISRIFVTKYGSWIFEYNDIIKHYISPMNINIIDSISYNNLFLKYEEEAYLNSLDSLKSIQNILSNQEKFFNGLFEDKKLLIFKELIKSMLSAVKSLHNFNEKCMFDIINKYLKNNNDKYNNSYVRLIAFIKKIYLRIVKLKLMINRIERFKINMKVIYDILNQAIPITLEENNKLAQNNVNIISSEIEFGKDSSFRKILNFINYCDNKHDYYSSEFINKDLTSYIANVLSSNDYIKSMKLKNGLNMTSIKSKNNSKEMANNINNIIINNIIRKKRFSSIKNMEGHTTNPMLELNENISREITSDENKDINNSEIFDTMILFDQSKQKFYVEGEKADNFPDKLIKQILEEELNSDDKAHKAFILDNDLYSILIKKKKKERSNDNISLLNISNDTNTTYIEKTNSNESLEKMSSNDSAKKNEIFQNEKVSLIKMGKKDFKKISIYFKEIEKQIYLNNLDFKEIQKKLIEMIKNKLDNCANKEIKKKKEGQEIKEIENIFKNNDDDDEIIINIEEINDSIDKKTDDKIDLNNFVIIDNKIENNNKELKKEIEKKDEIMIEEETIPIFSAIPEFEEIAKSKKFICFEEKYILKDSNKYEIIVYYPKQFEALRIAYCSTTENFLKSLSKSFEWTENSGGKSKAGFYKTFDNKFILKNVSETEFEMFLDNALEYFKYVSKFLFHKMPSILAKILGAYKITTQHKNKEVKYNLILMENLFYGMMTKNNATFNSRDSSLKVYDLKGSNINRYITKNNRRPGQVLLDTNFLVDFNKEPVNIDSYVYSKLNLALLNDSEYLKKSGVVDYSLLIIFDSEGSEKQKLEEVGDNVYYDYETNNFFSEKEKSHCLIKLGIIDYIRKYTWDKKMEFYGKSIIYRDNPTIVDPNVYRDRFYKTISRYFVGV